MRWYLIVVLICICIISDVEHLHVPAGHRYVFGEKSFRSSAHFSVKSCLVFIVVELYMSFLYILEIKPLSVLSFADVFCHSERCLFVFCFLWFPLLCRTFKLGPICLFLRLFVWPWESDLRKHLYNLCQRMFCLCSLLGV